MQLSMAEVAATLGSSCGTPERIVQGYSIDSRSILPGQLFFAIRGPRFDGNQFVGQAIERGAVGAVVERAFHEQASPKLAPVLIPVVDTVQALQRLAQAVRRKWGRKIIGITGSTGKTTTKEMLAALLSRRLCVRKSRGNFNNFYGLPLTLLALEPEHELAVVELAMSATGEIARLAQIAEVEIGVVTNVGPVHLEFFDSVEAIARAKRELIENLQSPGVAVLNHDDPRVREFGKGFKDRVVTFGFGEGADFRVVELRAQEGAGSHFRVVGPRLKGEFYVPLPGRHNVENAIAAIATASLFEVPTSDLQEALAEFQNLHLRSEVLTLAGGITLINDCYNSNPLAMERTLDTLANWPNARRKIVVAGEMLELGPTSREWHHAIGRRCAEIGVDWLLAVQGDAQYFLAGAREAGLKAERGRFFLKAEAAGEFCRGLIEPGDVVLVKGSRAVHLETVSELLRSSGESASPAKTNSGHES